MHHAGTLTDLDAEPFQHVLDEAGAGRAGASRSSRALRTRAVAGVMTAAGTATRTAIRTVAGRAAGCRGGHPAGVTGVVTGVAVRWVVAGGRIRVVPGRT